MKGTRTLLCSSILRVGFFRVGFLSVALISIGSVTLGGCNNKPAPVPPPQQPVAEPEVAADVEHRISYSGETLAVIAAWYTGRATNWQAIRDANPGLRPERLNLGQVILIPGDLVVQHEPMPKRFVTDNAAKARAKAAADTKPLDEATGADTDTATDPYNSDPYSSEPSSEDKAPSAIADEPSVPSAVAKEKADPLAIDPGFESEPPAAVGTVEKEAPKKPTPAPYVAAEPPVVSPTAVPPTAKEAAPPAMDSEREKLLDELLAQ